MMTSGQRQPCPKCATLNCVADDICVSCGYDLSPVGKTEPSAPNEGAAAKPRSRPNEPSQAEMRTNEDPAAPASGKRDRGGPFGWMSIVCACLSALLLSLVFLFLSLPVIVIPFGGQEPMWLYADDRSAPLEVLYVIPLLWVAAIVFGIVAVRRGDRRRGIAGLILCGLEVALGVDVVCLGCMLLTIAG